VGWELTAGLQNLRTQVNRAFPARDKTSDGSIGDTAHQSETSGHNPDSTPGSKAEWQDGDSIPEVRAWDMDSDLRADGVTAQQLVDHIRALPGVSSVLRYIIYNRKIYRASNGWAAEAYDGPSAHTEHVHFSGAYSQAADENTSFDFMLDKFRGDDMLPKKGDSGEEVKFWQYVLNDLGYKLDVDGDYGPATEAAVNAYRKKAGVDTTISYISGWQGWRMLRDMAAKYAGQDGAPGAPGKDGTLGGTLTVLGGQLQVEAG
jgi:hypothetical protein